MSDEQLIPEILRKLQTTGEEAIGRLEESKDKRAVVAEWCRTGTRILSEYLDRRESMKLLLNTMSETQSAKQPQENHGFSERLI